MRETITRIALVAAMTIAAVAPVAALPGQETNDPFTRVPKKVTKPPAEEKDASKPVLVPFPPLEQRQQDYLREKQLARSQRRPEPDAIGQYLVSELAVTGVFQTDRGVGAFIQAIPTKTTFFVTPGTRVFNGKIETIVTGSNFDLGQVVFTEMTVYEEKKKKKEVYNTVTKTIAAPAGKGR